MPLIFAELGSAILFNESTDNVKEEIRAENQQLNEEKMEEWWSLYFDGSAGKEGARAGIWITNPNDESKF